MFHDNDSRVRYYACETLYNVIKLTRKETKNFLNEIFDAISRVSFNTLVYKIVLDKLGLDLSSVSSYVDS